MFKQFLCFANNLWLATWKNYLPCLLVTKCIWPTNTFLSRCCKSLLTWRKALAGRKKLWFKDYTHLNNCHRTSATLTCVTQNKYHPYNFYPGDFGFSSIRLLPSCCFHVKSFEITNVYNESLFQL